MNKRQRFVIRAALLYIQSNLDDLNEAFQEDDYISVNGELGKEIDEDEVEEILYLFQD